MTTENRSGARIILGEESRCHGAATRRSVKHDIAQLKMDAVGRLAGHSYSERASSSITCTDAGGNGFARASKRSRVTGEMTA